MTSDPFNSNIKIDYLRGDFCNQSDSDESWHEEEDWDTIINKIDDIREINDKQNSISNSDKVKEEKGMRSSAFDINTSTTDINDSSSERSKSLKETKIKIRERYNYLDSCLQNPHLVTSDNYLHYLRGRLIPILKKKKGALMMIKFLLYADESVLDLIVNEIFIQLTALINNCYANYFIELLMLIVNESHQLSILEIVFKNLRMHLKNKFSLRFLISLVDLPFFSNPNVLKLTVSSILENSTNVMKEKNFLKFLASLIKRLDYKSYPRIFVLIEENLTHFLKGGLFLIKSILQTQQDPLLFTSFVKLLSPHLSVLLRSEAGYEVCCNLVKSAKKINVIKFVSASLKEKIDDTIYIINNKGKVKSKLKIYRLEEVPGSSLTPTTLQSLFNSVLSNLDNPFEKFTMQLLNLMVVEFEDNFIKQLVETKLHYIIVTILANQTGFSLLNALLKVSKSIRILEYVKKLLIDTRRKYEDCSQSLSTIIMNYNATIKSMYSMNKVYYQKSQYCEVHVPKSTLIDAKTSPAYCSSNNFSKCMAYPSYGQLYMTLNSAYHQGNY